MSGPNSPLCYPKHNSYKNVINQFMANRDQLLGNKKAEPCGSDTSATSKAFSTITRVPSVASICPKPGDYCMRYKLKDGGKLTVIKKKGEEIVYCLRCVEGRKVILEKSPAHMCLVISDEHGKPVKTLACQL